MFTRQRNGGVISRAREGTRASRAFINTDAHHPQKLRSPNRRLRDFPVSTIKPSNSAIFGSFRLWRDLLPLTPDCGCKRSTNWW
jgi:hypothetical protein